MCHINILYVYGFNITSSLINIHVINHINGCDAEEQYSHLSASRREFTSVLGEAKVGVGMAAAGETDHGKGAHGFSPALGAGWPRPTNFPFGINLAPLASASGAGDRQH